jgi:excisionase family DNA binding protein
MDKEFVNIDDVSKYLGIKRSTLYQKVERREIPFYRFGRLIRFKKADIELWTEGFRSEPIDSDEGARRFIVNINRGRVDIGRIVKKTIEEVKGFKYTHSHRRPDQDKGLRKEVSDGTL